MAEVRIKEIIEIRGDGGKVEKEGSTVYPWENN